MEKSDLKIMLALVTALLFTGFSYAGISDVRSISAESFSPMEGSISPAPGETDYFAGTVNLYYNMPMTEMQLTEGIRAKLLKNDGTQPMAEGTLKLSSVSKMTKLNLSFSLASADKNIQPGEKYRVVLESGAVVHTPTGAENAPLELVYENPGTSADVLEAVTLYPENGATGVETDLPGFSATFNRAPHETEAIRNAACFPVISGDPDYENMIALTPQWNENKLLLPLPEETTLSAETTYTIMIVGEGFDFTADWRFTTGSSGPVTDTLAVTATDPVQYATGVDPDIRTFTLTFNHPLSAEGIIAGYGPSPVMTTRGCDITVNGNTVTLTRSDEDLSPLVSGTYYLVVTGIKDTEGNLYVNKDYIHDPDYEETLGHAFILTFTVGGGAAGGSIFDNRQVTPAENAELDTLNEVKIMFMDLLDQSKINNGPAPKLYRASDMKNPVAIGTYDVSVMYLTLNFDKVPLASGIEYKIVVEAGTLTGTDLDGNTDNNPKFELTYIGAGPATSEGPALVSSDPADYATGVNPEIQTFTLVFDKNISPEGITAGFGTTIQAVTHSCRVSTTGKVLTLTRPDDDNATLASETYYLLIDGIKDTQGNLYTNTDYIDDPDYAEILGHTCLLQFTVSAAGNVAMFDNRQISPAENSEMVYLNRINIMFMDLLDQWAVSGGPAPKLYKISDPGNSVATGKYSVNASYLTLDFENVPLEAGTAYKIAIGAGVMEGMDMEGNTATNPAFELTYRGAVPDDTEPPYLVSTAPAEGETNVSPDITEFTATFNEPIQLGVEGYYWPEGGENNKIPIRYVTVSDMNIFLTRDEENRLQNGLYFIGLTGVKDKTGNEFAGDCVWSFRVGPIPPLAVLDVEPADNTEIEDINGLSSIRITFDKEGLEFVNTGETGFSTDKAQLYKAPDMNNPVAEGSLSITGENNHILAVSFAGYEPSPRAGYKVKLDANIVGKNGSVNEAVELTYTTGMLNSLDHHEVNGIYYDGQVIHNPNRQKIIVTNMLGRIVETTTENVDMSAFPRGIYPITIPENSQTIKIIY